MSSSDPIDTFHPTKAQLREARQVIQSADDRIVCANPKCRTRNHPRAFRCLACGLRIEARKA